ncbi:MAG: DUF4173 domain-containing protein [Clostridia bacterium]|nr:DUF4173 domain-containing protein [Clostridia bacterium]
MCDERLDTQMGTPSFGVPQNPEKPPYFACAAEKWALPAAWLLGWLYLRLILIVESDKWYSGVYFTGHGGWTLNLAPLLFAVMFSGAILCLLAARQRVGAVNPFPAESWIWFGCLLLVAGALTFNRCSVLGEGETTLLLHGYAIWWAVTVTGGLTDGKTGGFVLLDLACGIGRAFSGLVYLPVGVWHLVFDRERKARQKITWVAVLYLFLALIGLVLATKWLAGADRGFENLLGRFFVFDGWEVGVNLFYLILALPVGAFFYGLAVLRPQRKSSDLWSTQAAKLRQVPVGLACGVLVAFFVLYLLFFGVQGEYLFGAFWGRLPEGFTVAEYARRGFFELCLVMLLNFALLAVSVNFAEKRVREHKLLRMTATALLGFSLLLWSTAAAKLGLYIVTFGFTPKRLLAAWALLVILVAGVRATANLWKNCSIIRPAALVGGISLALLCLV